MLSTVSAETRARRAELNGRPTYLLYGGRLRQPRGSDAILPRLATARWGVGSILGNLELAILSVERD